MGSALTRESRNLLIAMSLGDGYLHDNGQLMMGHGEQQYDYLYHKYTLIKSVCSLPRLKKYFHNQIGKEVTEYTAQTKRLKFLRVVKKFLYPYGVKTLSRKVLDRIGTQGLAILWMDDGNRWIRYRKSRNSWDVAGRLFLCVDKEQSQIFLDWIRDTHDIHGYMIKKGSRANTAYYTIMFNGRQLQKLSNLIRPFIIPQMEYKINPVIVGQDGAWENPMVCSYIDMIREDENGSTPLKAQLVRSACLAEKQEEIV